MTSSVAVPLHLAVHVLGVAVALGIATYAVSRRGSVSSGGWLGVLVGAGLLAASHVGAGALWAGGFGWPVYARAAGYAALAVGLAGGPSGLPVVTVVAPLGAHVTAALTGLLAAASAVMGRAARGREGLLLGAGLGLWAVGDLLAYGQPVAAAVLSVAGSVVAGAWLLARSRSSLLARLLASFLAALLVLVVGIAAAAGVLFASDLRGERLEQLEDLAAARADQVQEDWPAELLALATPLAGRTLADRFASGADLNQDAQGIAALPGVDTVVLLATNRTVVGSWDAGVRRGPVTPADELRVAGHDTVSRALVGSRTSGVIELGESDLLAIAAVPVAPVVDGQLRRDLQTGVLVVGRRISDVVFVSDIRERSGVDAAVLVGGGVAVSSLAEAVSGELPSVAADVGVSGQVDIGGTSRFVATAGVEGADGVRIATIMLILDAASVADVEAAFTRALFLAALGSALAAALLFAVASKRTTQPVRELTTAAARVATGDLDAHVDVQTADEVGRLADSFNSMTSSLRQRETELRDAAAVEADLRGRLETVTSSMTEALLAVDRDGIVQTANPAAADLLSVPLRDVIGRPIDRLLHGVDETGTPLLEALGTHDARQVASVRGMVRSSSDAVAVAATAAPLRMPDGAVAGRVYVLRDRTGEAQAERMKTEFLANVSHELRTPLTPIKGYAELLRSGRVDPARATEVAETMSTSVRLLERIIGMLLDFAALEAGKLEVQLEPTDLGEVVDEVIAEWRDRRSDRRITRRLARDLPAVVADPKLLNRTLTELVHNAIKFSDGPVRIRGEQDGRVVRLTVSDSGQGIAPEHVERITQDFQQLDGSATRRHGGLGLGLTLVHGILQRFGGDMAVDSALGEGTDVHLLLRVADDRTWR